MFGLEKKKKATSRMGYRQMAEDLMTTANQVAVSSRVPFLLKLPQLLSAQKISDWDFFTTVAAVWSAFFHIQFEVPTEFGSETEEIVTYNLGEWHPQGISAMNDLASFVQQRITGETDPSKRQQLVKHLAGTWIVWNLTDMVEIQDEGVVAGALGNFFFKKFTSYWRNT